MKQTEEYFRVKDWLEDFSKKRGEPIWMRNLRLDAFDYFYKLPPSPTDPELNLDTLIKSLESGKPAVDNIKDLSREALEQLEKLGLSEEEKQVLSGTSLSIDNVMISSNLSQQLRRRGVIIDSTDEAVKKYDWMKNYMFKILDYKKSRLAALHAAFWSGGVTIRVPRGVKIHYPVNSFFLIVTEGIGQTEHSIVIAEEDSVLHFTEGCIAPTVAKYSVHLGGNEIFVGKNAFVKATALQNWIGKVHHRPVKATCVEEGGKLNEISITLGGVSTVARPVVHLTGEEANATLQSISLVDKDREVHGGGIIIHEAPKTSSEIINRSVVKDNGYEAFYGRIWVKKNAEYSLGHMACNSYLLNSGAKSFATPELLTEADEVTLSHEAAVGKIGKEKLFYLQSMGFTEEESLALVVNGFFDPVLKDVPFEYLIEVRKVIDLALKGA